MTQHSPFEAYTSPTLYHGYTVHSCYIPMRDGVRLAADIILPKGLPVGTRIPALLNQTRYWRDTELRAPFKWFYHSTDELHPIMKYYRPFFTSRGYALVNVDVRGTGASFGVWQYPWEAASVEDGSELVEWIIHQPWSNGCVGGVGISYPGTTAELLLASGHPAVKAVLPMFNHPDAYLDVALPGGAFNQRFVRTWGHMNYLLDQNQFPEFTGWKVRLFAHGAKKVGGRAGWKELKEAVRLHQANGRFDHIEGIAFRDEVHPGFGHSVDDVTILRYYQQISTSLAATYGWASWMDAATADAAIRRFLTFPNATHLVVGAWTHGGSLNASPYRNGDVPVEPDFLSQWNEQLRFFDAHLKGIDNAAATEKVVHYYTLGAEKWQKASTWPPAGVQMEKWYFTADRSLRPQPPEETSAADQYTVDFSATTGEHNRWWELGPIWNISVNYANRAEQASHLLCYNSLPLERELEISGYPVVRLFITSDEPDVIFYVYLEDVAPDGTVYYLTEGILRSIHRKVSNEASLYHLQVPYHSFRKADALPLVPDEMAEISFGLNPISALLHKGHCLRVSLAGHDADNFPRIPQKNTPHWIVRRDSTYPSGIDLPVRHG
jgi:putative CocE/NonD family hydrolase